MTQTRWICGACDREWVWAYDWQAAQGCPLCGHQGIRQETYTPAFPGGDIPRDGDHSVTAAPRTAPEQRNGTLAASSPEFNS